MARARSASDKLMGDYFSALLQEEPKPEPQEVKPVLDERPTGIARPAIAPEPLEKLLAQVDVDRTGTEDKAQLETAKKLAEAKAPEERAPGTKVARQVSRERKIASAPRSEKLPQVEPGLAPQVEAQAEKKATPGYREGKFQALFFDVAGRFGTLGYAGKV